MAEEDLIFGKMRHLFGGIEPSNMEIFTATVENGEVKINAQLPGNTIVDNQILCTVAGAVIRRKSTEYPKNEFDGDLVADITTSGTITDSTADSTATYYYAAFPYSTKGVYNRNHINRSAINLPDPMVSFSAKSGGSVIKLTAELPLSAVGAVIRKSTGGYPASPEDGEEFMTITSNGTYIDSNVIIGLTYYYSAFPYNSSGVYSMDDPKNRASTIVKTYSYLYGYDLDTTDSDPATRVSYPSDVQNTEYTAAYMDFTAGTFNYGSWNIPPGEKFMPRPCMLTYAGVVDHYLNPDDYTKKTDGTASSVANTSFSGNAMMEWPKIWVKRWEENGVYHFRCSDVQIDEDYECWSNYDRQNNQIEHFYTPIYFGSDVSSKMRSISGQSNLVSKTASTEITLAKANGNDWYTEVLVDRLLIQDLLVLMAKNTDGQTAYGSGRSLSSNSSAIGQGTMNTKGMFWGSNDGTSGVKVFGMENLWGNLWRRTAGWIHASGTQKVKLTRGTHDGSTATDYNTDGSGYLTVSGAAPTGSSGGYIKTMKTMPYGRIPYDASGSTTTYEADGLWFHNSQTSYAMVGGTWNYVLDCGPFCTSLYAMAGTSYAGFGSALSCKPSVT